MHNDKIMNPANAYRLDNPACRKRIPPEKLVELIAPFRGMALADIGVGTGYCSLPALDAVGGEAVLYALDAQQAMLDKLAERLADYSHASAVKAILTPTDRIELPDETADIVTACSVYHELPDRENYVHELYRILKHGGRLVVVDWSPLPDGVEREGGPPNGHCIEASQARTELTAAGFYEIVEHKAFAQLWALTAKK